MASANPGGTTPPENKLVPLDPPIVSIALTKSASVVDVNQTTLLKNTLMQTSKTIPHRARDDMVKYATTLNLPKCTPDNNTIIATPPSIQSSQDSVLACCIDACSDPAAETALTCKQRHIDPLCPSSPKTLSGDIPVPITVTAALCYPPPPDMSSPQLSCFGVTPTTVEIDCSTHTPQSASVSTTDPAAAGQLSVNPDHPIAREIQNFDLMHGPPCSLNRPTLDSSPLVAHTQLTPVSPVDHAYTKETVPPPSGGSSTPYQPTVHIAHTHTGTSVTVNNHKQKAQIASDLHPLAHSRFDHTKQLQPITWANVPPEMLNALLLGEPLHPADISDIIVLHNHTETLVPATTLNTPNYHTPSTLCSYQTAMSTVQNDPTTDILPVLTTLTIEGRTTTVLVDTGANISCISTSWFNQLPSEIKNTMTYSPHIKARDAQQQLLPYKGTLRLDMATPNHPWTYNAQWHVMDSLPFNVILGVNTLVPLRSVIDLDHGTLTFRGALPHPVITPIWWLPTHNQTRAPHLSLSIVTDVTLAPDTSTMVFAGTQVQDSTQWIGTIGHIETTRATKPFMVAHSINTIATSNKSTEPIGCEVLLTNFTERPIHLSKNTIVAEFFPIEEGDSVTLIIDPSVTPPDPFDQPLPTPHPTRLPGLLNAMVHLAESAQMDVTTTDKEENLPLGVPDPLTFDLPGIKDEDRPEMAAKIRTLLNKWLDVFSANDHDFGHCTVETLFIDLTTDKPVNKRPYNIPRHLWTPLQQQLKDLFDAGVIEDACSPYSAPIVLVAKKDGGIRICLDFRQLNAVTKKDGYPLPRIDTALGMLRGAKVFSAMDLNGGYHQIAVAEEDKEKLAFITPWGQFQFKRAPFGVTNMPAVFSRMMNKVFAGMLWIHVLIYLDDILLMSTTTEEHLHLLDEVFSRLRKAGLKLKGKKCAFFMQEVSYLGHRVCGEGVKVDPTKVEAIRLKTYPVNLNELRSDLGLFSYYRMFVENFSKIATPLTKLLGQSPIDRLLTTRIHTQAPPNPDTTIARNGSHKTDKTRPKKRKNNALWEWGPEQAQAYDTLKNALVQAPVLAHPDFTKPFIIDTDASQFALGAVCSQTDTNGNEKPIAFASRTLSASERNYSATKREALGVFWGVHKAFHAYTYGAPFILRTDHSALTTIFKDGQAPERIIAGWQLALSAYDFDISHRAGKDHLNADGLSRPSQDNLVPGPEDPDLTYPTFVSCIFANTLALTAITTTTPGTTPTTHAPVSPIATPLSTTQLDSIGLTSKHNKTLLPDRATILHHQHADTHLSTIRTYLLQEQGWDTTAPADRLEASRCVIVDNIVYIWVWEQRSLRKHKQTMKVWLPTSLVPSVLHLCHDSPLAGHLDTQRTFARLSSTFWWPTLWHDTKSWIEQCDPCQKVKIPRTQHKGQIHDGFVPKYPFQYVAMDITELPASNNDMQHILVFLDLYTRWVEIKVFDHCPDAVEITDALLTQVITRHGTPEFLISDNGPNIAAEVITQVCRNLETKRIFASPYSPQTNGAVERFNRTLKSILAKLVQDRQYSWLQYLPSVIYAYRTAYHASIQDSPFFLLYGRDPRSNAGIDTNYLEGVAHDDGLFHEHFIERTQYARSMVNDTITKTTTKSKKTFNSKTHPNPVLSGLVLRAINIPQRVNKDLPVKLRPKWDGPYRILRQTAPLTYDIQKIGSLDVEKAHVRHLKPYHYRNVPTSTTPTSDPLASAIQPEFEVDKIVDTKWDPTTQIPLYKVRWRGYTSKHDTWEPLTALTLTAKEALTDYLNHLSAPATITPNRKRGRPQGGLATTVRPRSRRRGGV